MRHIVSPALALNLLLLVSSLRAQTPENRELSKNGTLRTWTTTDGRLFQAVFVDTDGFRVALQPPSGKPVILPLKTLSAQDIAFLRAQLGIPGAGTPSQGRPVTKTQSRGWPEKATPDEKSIAVQEVQQPSSAQGFLYHSRSFEFLAQEKLAGSVMQEVVRTFEATRTLLEVLPWGIQPRPPEDFGYYRAKLYADRERYIQDGGPRNSAGYYSPATRVFKIPFESLGLELRGKTWYKKPGYNNETIIHEVTHQLMEEFLGFLPVWMIEGTAEYTAMLPFQAGTFFCNAHDRGMREYFKTYQARTGGSFSEIGPLLPLLSMPAKEWNRRGEQGPKEQNRLYAGACLLVYFFCHLDGDGRGTAFLKYWDEMREAHDAWATFFKNPSVHRNPDGSFTYPQSVQLPSQPHSEVLGIELVKILLRGRDENQLRQDFRFGVQKIGIR
jgi:hypothetical protein